MNEIFKDVVGYEGLYVVSNQGNIYSLNYNRTGKVVKLSPKITKGYLQVCLCKNGEHKWFSVHRLVAQAFLPNSNNYPQVNHKDENKQNNYVENLEWCTAEYNNNYGTRTEKCSKQVAQYDLNGNYITTWKSTKEIERQLGFDNSSISACCLGRYKQAYNFIWKYL